MSKLTSQVILSAAKDLEIPACPAGRLRSLALPQDDATYHFVIWISAAEQRVGVVRIYHFSPLLVFLREHG